MTRLTFAGDESGDVSFSFDKGASRHFVVAAVATERPEVVASTLAGVRQTAGLNASYEFRLNSLSSRPLRRRVYEALAATEFDAWAVWVDKATLPAEYRLFPGPIFYSFFVAELIRAIPLSIRCGATLILDQFGSPASTRANIKRTLRIREIEVGFQRIRIGRSESEPLIQVADLMAGALLRKAKGENEAHEAIRSKFRAVAEYRG